MSVLSSLFVGIDVSKNSNQVYAMNFDQEKLLTYYRYALPITLLF